MSCLPRSLETNGLVSTTQPSAAPVTSPCIECVPSFAASVVTTEVRNLPEGNPCASLCLGLLAR